jgi:hypothetical protein
VDLPVDAAATGWAVESPGVCRRPRRLFELDLIDLPVRHASPAEKEGQRDWATYLQ